MPIDAVYRKGVIKPMKKLDLREDEEIEIEIRRKKHDPVGTLRGIIKVKNSDVRELLASEEWY